EIDKYLPKIEELLGDLSKEELIKKMFSLEFNRFIEYYKKQNTIDSPKSREKGEGSVNSDGSVRYFLNLGSRDNFDWMSLKDFLRDSLDLGRDDLFKVDVKEGFSFFNTDASHSERVMEILNNMHHEEITMEEAEVVVSVVKDLLTVAEANVPHQIEDHQVENEEQKVNLVVAEKMIVRFATKENQ